LGNPGDEYARTRHNAGFLLVAALARRWGADWRKETRFSARVARARPDGTRVVLCQPQTYMNASGEAVGALVRFYQCPPERLLVVVDDADLPVGTLRLRPQGSSGGHHGLESVEAHLGTRQWPRLRLGIGRRAEQGREITGHVLGRFEADESEWFERVLDNAVAAVECWLRDGVTQAMNRFNGVVAGPEQRQPE
jgi:PTH1 family peptidyl-tRNA hydrolase